MQELLVGRKKLALMPAREREPRNPDRNSKKRNAGRRNEEKRCEKPRNVELKSREENLIR